MLINLRTSVIISHKILKFKYFEENILFIEKNAKKANLY